MLWRSLPPLSYISQYCNKRSRYASIQRRILHANERQPRSQLSDLETARSIPMTPIQCGPGAKPEGLLRILSLYPTMAEVTESLHQTDLLNLTLTSKSVRNCVFAGVGSDINSLKERTCFDQKSSCRGCGIQICPVWFSFSFFKRSSTDTDCP